jgi:hypothetical protein
MTITVFGKEIPLKGNGDYLKAHAERFPFECFIESSRYDEQRIRVACTLKLLGSEIPDWSGPLLTIREFVPAESFDEKVIQGFADRVTEHARNLVKESLWFTYFTST